MGDDKISYKDVEEYQKLFTLAPSFLLETFARRNTDLVSKFKSTIQHYMSNLTPEQKEKLDLILNSEVDELQAVMHEAYLKTRIKQYKILANPKYKQFIKDNLDGIRRMIN